jgi:hypothetical protein
MRYTGTRPVDTPDTPPRSAAPPPAPPSPGEEWVRELLADGERASSEDATPKPSARRKRGQNRRGCVELPK